MSTLSFRSFVGGELSPSLYSRVDLSKYGYGLRTSRNGQIKRHGGWESRSGTTLVAPANHTNSEGAVRTIPFILDENNSYILEMAGGGSGMRFVKNGAQIMNPSVAITGITQANPAVVTAVGHGYVNGQDIDIRNVVGMTQVNGRRFVVAGAAANTFQLQVRGGTGGLSNVNSTGYSAYVSGGSVASPYTIALPYSVAELPSVNFSQSTGSIILVHPSHAPREITRVSDTNWTSAAITFAPSIGTPQNVSVSPFSPWLPNTPFVEYQVSAIKKDTLEESFVGLSDIADGGTLPTGAAPVTISWTAVTDAIEYRVYRRIKRQNGASDTTIGLLTITRGLVATDYDDVEVDINQRPIVDRAPFGSANNYPSAVSHYQQRRVFAATNNEPDVTWASVTGSFNNFTYHAVTQDNDSIKFRLLSDVPQRIRHLIDLGRLLEFTSKSEFAINGDGAGTLVPTAINPKRQSANGSGTVAPVVVDGSPVYLQARSGVIRDLGFDQQVEGYRGNEMSIFASHLFDGYTITALAYQQMPNQTVWAVRSDGVLLGMTYVREQMIVAWHRHDTDGTVESIASIPEGSEDALYMVVRRTINGEQFRYIERMNTRRITDVRYMRLMDSVLSYDGVNASGTTMTLSGGTTWAYDETITCTASVATFLASNVGDQVQFGDLRFTITGFNSSTAVTGKPNKTVPVALRGVATTTWALAVDTVSGLWHLEGKRVSILGDGYVVASPNNYLLESGVKNYKYDDIIVTNGSITLPKPYAVIQVGLPFIADLRTLEIDTPQGETLTDKKKLITKLTMRLEESRGGFFGHKPPESDSTDALQNLDELKARQSEDYDSPIDLLSGLADIDIPSDWNSDGSVFMRQVDPLPLTILSIHPSGLVPFRGA